MTRRPLTLSLALLLGACSAGPATTTPSASGPFATGLEPTAAAVAPTPTPQPWNEDLDQLDRAVRTRHVSPFTIHPEAEWSERLAEVRGSIATSSPDEQLVLLSSLVGLLDTHSAIVAMPGGFHFYGILLYRFTDGWFVVRAKDESLVGSRAVSVGGLSMDKVEQRLTPLVPHDNRTGLLEGLEWQITTVEFLHGTGIVTDPARPSWVLELADGTRVTVDPPQLDEAAWSTELATVGWLLGAAPEAVARRTERIWTRLDKANRTFLIAVNDYGDMTSAGTELTAALDADKVDRVVLDARYLRGGNGDIKILEVIAADGRINRAGHLIGLIGRENVSAGTQVASFLDTETEALLVGEPTPARADNFLCPCADITLEHSGFAIQLPTYWARTGDQRDSVPPDVEMLLSARDFFAGRDPVLDAALEGLRAP